MTAENEYIKRIAAGQRHAQSLGFDVEVSDATEISPQGREQTNPQRACAQQAQTEGGTHCDQDRLNVLRDHGLQV